MLECARKVFIEHGGKAGPPGKHFFEKAAPGPSASVLGGLDPSWFKNTNRVVVQLYYTSFGPPGDYFFNEELRRGSEPLCVPHWAD